MRINLLIDKVEEMESVEEITNTVVNNFEDYPNIKLGFISDQERYSVNKFRQQIINILNVINNFSIEEFDALNLAIEDVGPWDFEEIVDAINREDYIYFPDVESDYDLGEAYVDYVGSVEEAVDKTDLTDYINIRAVADYFYEENEEFEEENDLDIEDYIDIAKDEVEDNPEKFLKFFNYEAFGKDLRLVDGYYIGSTGAIWIQ